MTSLESGIDPGLAALASRPLASRRWVTRKNARTGMVKRVEEAMIAPQLVEFWP
jgi:hypothetical protein